MCHRSARSAQRPRVARSSRACLNKKQDWPQTASEPQGASGGAAEEEPRSASEPQRGVPTSMSSACVWVPSACAPSPG
eukprot:567819-Pyramimonas_sp.AAC.1